MPLRALKESGPRLKWKAMMPAVEGRTKWKLVDERLTPVDTAKKHVWSSALKSTLIDLSALDDYLRTLPTRCVTEEGEYGLCQPSNDLYFVLLDKTSNWLFSSNWEMESQSYQTAGPESYQPPCSTNKDCLDIRARLTDLQVKRLSAKTMRRSE